MAKNSIRDYSATNSSNTDIQSIDISEGCSPAGINNAIREVMADLKDVSTGAVALESPAADSLSVTGDLTVDTNTLYVDSTNNQVGIGTTTHYDSSTKLTVAGRIHTSNGTAIGSMNYGGGAVINVGSISNHPLQFITNNTTRATIDTSGNLLVGKTSYGAVGAGSGFGATGINYMTADGSATLRLNRETSDGEIVSLRKDNTTVGSIGSETGYTYYAGGTAGLMMRVTDVIPTDGNGTKSDNAKDLGDGAYRFDDVFATNGTIQTSDANEKQQIAALTDAEITAAKAIGALFKTFKWNSAVEGKGDAARTHAGVIAQDVEAAMSAAGLDAGDYAFFISSTWWETQTEVPAVEAVDAVLDEDGNVVTEAVEAADAYTRTDTYDTAEEAPEGATERNRKGIRYPELLAFVGAATEQRLANIETRLAALEAN